MAGYKAKKNEEKAIQNTPVPGNRTIVHKNKTFKEIIGDSTSTIEDRQIAFENRMKNQKSGIK